MSESVISPAPHEPSPAVPSQALPPFDSEKADVILRTSDGVDFRVFKVILSVASPFFFDLFGLPQDPAADEVQVVDVVESSSVMDKLLRFCYPCAPPIIVTLDELHTIMEAMQKYQMNNIIPEAQQQLRLFARSQPVAVFAIACHFGWEQVAKAAAKESLALPLRAFDKGLTVKELKYLTGEQYQALLKYHWQCSVAATAIIGDFKWLTNDGNGWVWFTCQTCAAHPTPLVVNSRLAYGKGETRQVRGWFMAFMERSKAIIADAPTAPISTIPLLTSALKQTHDCDNCRELAFEHLLKFMNEFMIPKMDQEIGSVVLELTF